MKAGNEATERLRFEGALTIGRIESVHKRLLEALRAH